MNSTVLTQLQGYTSPTNLTGVAAQQEAIWNSHLAADQAAVQSTDTAQQYNNGIAFGNSAGGGDYRQPHRRRLGNARCGPHHDAIRRSVERHAYLRNKSDSAEWTVGAHAHIPAIHQQPRLRFGPDGKDRDHRFQWRLGALRLAALVERRQALCPQQSQANSVLPTPPAESSTEFQTDLAQVESQGSLANLTSTDPTVQADVHLAELWAQDVEIPIGQVTQEVAQAENDDLAQNARLFGLVNIAEADARIAAWDTKYNYNAIRPISALNSTYDPSGWEPLLTTPNHPEYASGHSVTAAAGFGVLEGLYGDAVPGGSVEVDSYLYDPETGDPVAPLDYTSFSDLINAVGESRVDGGVHFQYSIDAANQIGSDVAGVVLDNELPVPEPTSLAAAAAVGSAILLRRSAARRGENAVALETARPVRRGAAGRPTDGFCTASRGGTRHKRTPAIDHVAEWFRPGPAKPGTWVQFPPWSLSFKNPPPPPAHSPRDGDPANFGRGKSRRRVQCFLPSIRVIFVPAPFKTKLDSPQQNGLFGGI